VLKSPRNHRKTTRTSLLCTLAVCTTLLVYTPLASAGKPGVFIGSETYFTLEHAVYTAGAEASALQFSLKMHNGSGSPIDFNGYGVQIVDGQGNGFPAKLTGKQSARVEAGQEQQFNFISQIAPGVSAADLKVSLFSWDMSSPSFMRSIGDLPVSTAISDGLDPSKLMLLSMKDVESSYGQDALAAIRLGQSYKVTQNGITYLYTDLYVRNTGAANFQLPSSLLLRLKGSDATAYSASFIGSSLETLLPNKLTKLRIRAVVPGSADVDAMKLEAYYSNATEERVLGSVPLSGMTAAVPHGSEQPYSMYGTDGGLKIKAEKTIAIKQAEGTMLQTTVTLRNDGQEVTALPSLSAYYQLGSESVAAAVRDSSVSSGYLPPNKTATYTYSVVIPDGVDPNTVKLALMEETGGASSSGSGSSGSGSNAGSGNSGSSGSSGNSSGSGNTASSGNTAGSGNSNSSGSSGSSNSSASNANKTSNTVNATSYPVMLIDLKGVQQASNVSAQAKPYQLGDPFELSSNGLIDRNLDVSLVELHMHENAELGYKTAIAKYKFTNHSSGSLAIPNIGTELVNESGLSYAGIRQTSSAATIMPNTSYVVSYSYLLPTNETGSNLALNIMDSNASGANKLTIGTFQVSVQRESSDMTVSFYPFDVKFNAYSIATLYNNGYEYILNLDLDISRRESVIVDQSFSKMDFELVDSLGRVLGSKSMAFTGTDRLISGSQKISFANIKTEQFENNMTINVYETIETSNGPVKRLVKQFVEKYSER